MGPVFLSKWNGKSLSELLHFMVTMMPPGQAGLLRDQEYADILATLLAENGFPAGDARELMSEDPALSQIVVTGIGSRL